MDEAKARIGEIGARISPDIMLEMRALFAQLLPPADPAIRVTHDLAYGKHERHRLNLCAPAGITGAPVLIFVHGGGFVAGDKDEAPGAFYDNVGTWAARRGMVGMTVNYRLAPDHAWPAGRDDVAAAVRWASESIGPYGGDPSRLFLMGHSAGAAHVAAAVGEAGTAASLAGCICLSGIYDLSIAPVNPAYFGEPELHAPRSPLEGLASAPIPLLTAVAEHDPPFIQRHTASLWLARLAARETLPMIFQLRGHNHFSGAFHIGSEDDAFGLAISDFVAAAGKN
ncbi:alpha/beta hydrolase [Sphingobium sp.]|uniref:alpha/beta hydrolase n=1 Tax=Sphingobium sp. TaxID=1912891 RepID=UPI0028BE4267|nr:alpha/beta hydrolase [Sphingobium sp.]